MKTGTVSYSASISGVLIKETIEIGVGDEKLEKIEIKTESESRLTATFHLKDVFTDKEAISLTQNIVYVLVNRLAYKLSCQVGEPRCDGWSLPKEDGSKHVVQGSFLIVNDIAEATIVPGDKTRENLKNFLGESLSELDRYLPFYRFAASQQDPVSRFLFLYNLLLMLNNDNQNNVDAAILAIDPNVTVTPSPIKKGKNETIYTRLRNEVAHIRQNVDHAKTADDIGNCVPGFQEIVRSVLGNI